MTNITRREFLKLTGVGTASLLAAPHVRSQEKAGEQPSNEPVGPYITCFYQFGRKALEALSSKEGLPNGPQYLHIFSHSHPGMRPHPDTANMVHAAGSSFKYALAFDVHKYKGWQSATEEQLKTWASEFRAHALIDAGPADYFAFNEMPTTGPIAPRLWAQAAQLVRYLHDPGDGPKLRGVFYFTERNLNPLLWQGEADDFWAALDETCDLVVGEHYHSYGFALDRTQEQLDTHLFALPKSLKASGKVAQISITAHKYAVLHSSYYGPKITGWAGVESGQHDPVALEKYFQHVVASTRRSEYGQRRIAFGPLATPNFDQRALPVLARVLGQDARTFNKDKAALLNL